MNLHQLVENEAILYLLRFLVSRGHGDEEEGEEDEAHLWYEVEHHSR